MENLCGLGELKSILFKWYISLGLVLKIKLSDERIKNCYILYLCFLTPSRAHIFSSHDEVETWAESKFLLGRKWTIVQIRNSYMFSYHPYCSAVLPYSQRPLHKLHLISV